MRKVSLAAAFVAASALRLGPAAAQTSGVIDRAIGTLIVAHGGGPEWNANVDSVAVQARLSGPVAVSFLMGPGAPSHRFQDAVRDLESRGAREIVVVPLLVSSHSGHYEQIRYLAGRGETLDTEMAHHLQMSGIQRPDSSVPLRLTPAMDDSPELAEVLADRARTLTKNPKTQALFLLGHGPNSAEDYAAWMSNLRRVADSVRSRTGFRSVLVDVVQDDAEPEVRAEAVLRVRELIRLQNEMTRRPVVVVPILVSSGQINTRKLPKDLEGLPVVYSGEALLPHPIMARWVEAQVSRSVESERRAAVAQ